MLEMRGCISLGENIKFELEQKGPKITLKTSLVRWKMNSFHNKMYFNSPLMVFYAM